MHVQNGYIKSGLLRQSFEFFCIPGWSDPGKVTQEFVSLLMVKLKLTLLMRKSSIQFNNA